MAHDRSKSEMTVTTCISRTELHEREDKFSVHNERRPHARSAKVIKRSVPAYASDLEMMRVAAQLSGLGRDDQASRTEHPCLAPQTKPQPRQSTSNSEMAR